MERTPEPGNGWPVVTLGEAVAVSRLRLEISQRELAKRCCLSRNTISLIERDKLHDLALSTFLTLHEVLHLPISIMIENWQNTLQYQQFSENDYDEPPEALSFEPVIDTNGNWNYDEMPELDREDECTQ